MVVFAIGIEDALHVPVEGLHDADVRQHRWPGPAVRYEDQGFNRGLPLEAVGLFLRKRGRVVRGVEQGYEPGE